MFGVPLARLHQLAEADKAGSILGALDMAKVACALHELSKYKELGGLDHLRELVEAAREGRCVVLPCKVGDRAWVIRTLLDGKGTKVVAPFGEIKQVSINSHGTFLVGDYCHTIDAEKIGDKIFLSEEAAEQALREE